MKTKSFSILVGALIVGSSACFAAGRGKIELILAGPVEAVDAQAGTVTILSHRVSVSDVSAFGVGTLVNVYGGLKRDSGISNAVVENLSRYASGSEQVFLKGAVSTVSASTAKIRIGDALVDYSALLAFSGFNVPAVGETVEISGIQPANRGVILASGLTEIRRPTGVVGSGVASTGVVGSGVASTGVVGSGVKGTGVVGSGVASTGVVGSGVKTAGVVGSGVASTGVVGSGVKTAGVVGSGVKTAGVVGSGVKTAGVVGSGVASTGVVGSGVKTAGVVGSGVASTGVVGSGVKTAGVVGSGAAAT